MIQVWFLVILITSNPSSIDNPVASVMVPQANQAQCEINKASIAKRNSTRDAYCIVGTLPKGQ